MGPDIFSQGYKCDHRTMSKYMNLRVRELVQPCTVVKDNMWREKNEVGKQGEAERPCCPRVVRK